MLKGASYQNQVASRLNENKLAVVTFCFEGNWPFKCHVSPPYMQMFLQQQVPLDAMIQGHEAASCAQFQTIVLLPRSSSRMKQVRADFSPALNTVAWQSQTNDQGHLAVTTDNNGARSTWDILGDIDFRTREKSYVRSVS